MCWENWQRNITQNRDRLEQYYTFSESPGREYWDFDFSGSDFRGRYFIQVHRQVDVPPHMQPDCIYVYFQAGKGRIALRNRIINNLGDLINKNGWSFRLQGEGKKLGDGKHIKYRIVNEDPTPQNHYRNMIENMILIARNLRAIEAGGPIVTD